MNVFFSFASIASKQGPVKPTSYYPFTALSKKMNLPYDFAIKVSFIYPISLKQVVFSFVRETWFDSHFAIAHI